MQERLGWPITGVEEDGTSISWVRDRNSCGLPYDGYCNTLARIELGSIPIQWDLQPRALVAVKALCVLERGRRNYLRNRIRMKSFQVL